MPNIPKAVAAYLLFALAPMLALTFANFLVEPGRAWFTDITQAQELGAWAAFVAWGCLSLRLFILPLDRGTA